MYPPPGAVQVSSWAGINVLAARCCSANGNTEVVIVDDAEVKLPRAVAAEVTLVKAGMVHCGPVAEKVPRGIDAEVSLAGASGDAEVATADDAEATRDGTDDAELTLVNAEVTLCGPVDENESW